MPRITRKAQHGPVHHAGSGFATLAVSIEAGISAAEAHRASRAATSAALASLGPVVYAVLTKDALVKFGHSVNLSNRLHAYGIGANNAKRLLMVKAGTLVDEQIVLARFAQHLARGREYFHPARDVLDYINSVRTETGVAALPF